MAPPIFKVAYNYCLTDSKGETPAMKLGLAKGLWRWKTLCTFKANPSRLLDTRLT
jgi:hypothetical protein